jgi:HEAT repeat protein
VLAKVFAESTNIYEKVEAAWALGQIGATEGIPVLKAALHDQNWHVVKQARRSLANIEQSLGAGEKSDLSLRVS